LPLGQLARSVPDALAAAQQWYADRGLPALFQVPLEARRLLDADLGERGWTAEGHTQLLTARLDRLRATGPAAPVTLQREPDDGWLSAYRYGDGASAAGRALLSRHDDAV